MSTSLPTKDAWHRNVNVRASAQERGLIYSPKQANSPRTPEEGTSYFKIMDCDYTFTLDTQKLQKRYLQLQRSLHPDNFSQKSVVGSGGVRDRHLYHLTLRRSDMLLKVPCSLMNCHAVFQLELEGMRIEEGTDSGADAEFLMELMEINEALDEAQTPEEANKIAQDTKGKLAELTEQTDAALRKGELQTAKALLAQMKYHANIEEKVKEKLSQFM
ncbi:hypothetical protein INR49_017405 [Caranx melampygus]|nr:hypothetical protein INR49_017405 [Caranx melampygus]